MKKNITILTCAVLLWGCTDFLIEAPKTSQSSELTMSLYAGLNQATAGAFSRLVSSGWYGPGFVFESEMRSGNGKRPLQTDYTSGRYIVSYSLDYNQTSAPSLWEIAYYVISAANNVIDNLTPDKIKTPITQQDFNNLHAECLFLRALGHFDLVRLYGQSYNYQPDSPGVPYIFHVDAPTEEPARNTVREVFDFIVADLRQAESLMADNYQRGQVSDPAATCTKPAIQALLSRVYLYMGQWQNAADYATKVINNTKFRMWTPDEYLTVWGRDIAGQGEVIFQVFGRSSNSYDAYWEGPAYMTNPAGYADCAASNDLVFMYDEDDVRGKLFKGVNDVVDLYWTLKYPGKGLGTPDYNNTVVLRLSEMYLNRAEAIVNGANVPGVTAASDLNIITSNRNAPAYTTVTRDDVFQERRKELAWEGHLWFDYSRCGRGMVRTDFTGTALVNKDVPYPDYRWAMPISERELRVNKNLVQNPGY
ncbi:MAG: RagB/SusD family nutrient uptake outer membrane protein [Bacteroidales bacterium]|nr:RagB/SusD family nutrient uptake outer membrane protein [Bacteroidales bacterium]